MTLQLCNAGSYNKRRAGQTAVPHMPARRTGGFRVMPSHPTANLGVDWLSGRELR